MESILTTERLYFREFTLNDAQLLVDLNSDPRVTKYTEKGPITTTAEAIQRLQKDILPQYQNKMGRWAVFLKSSDEFIGWCGVKYIESEKVYTIGYRFFHKHWGKGYATEAAKASLDYGTNILKLKGILAKAMKENTASIHVMKKLGMVYLKDEICKDHPAEVYIFP
jgi:[ribosomal protein S5]-alanine N-acetyltransferase